MAFNAKSLSRQSIGAAAAAGGSNTSTPFRYVTTDAKATVEAAGFFNNARNIVKKGDTVIVVSSFGGTPVENSYIFTSVPGTGNVVITAKGADGNGAAGVGAGYKIARGVAAVTGTLDVVTGLTTVVAVVATLQDNAALTGNSVTATIGDQAGAPAAGSVTLKVWKPTASGDGTPIAATAAKSVNWVAIGV